MEYLYIILYITLWLIALFYYYIKNETIDAGFVLIFSYLLYAVSSYALYTNVYYTNIYYGVTSISVSFFVFFIVYYSQTNTFLWILSYR